MINIKEMETKEQPLGNSKFMQENQIIHPTEMGPLPEVAYFAGEDCGTRRKQQQKNKHKVHS